MARRRKGGRVSFNKNFNINRVVSRLVNTILALYVGGTVLSTFGTVMNGTASPFYSGLTLIGWTTATVDGVQDTITSTSGSGILSVVGIIAIAGVILEFISFKY